MFALKIATLQPPPRGTQFGGVRRSSRIKFSDSFFSYTEIKGVAHLFRSLTGHTFPYHVPFEPFNGIKRTALVFIVSVPMYLSHDDFIIFCGSYIKGSDLCFIRNDSVKDRYSVMIKLVNQNTADEFLKSVNGKQFDPLMREVCHTYFIRTVEYIDSTNIAGIPQPCYSELPSCPTCLVVERLDKETSTIKITGCDHFSECSCATKRSCKVCRYCQKLEQKPTCADCEITSSLWVCLICSFVGCGRDEKGHALKHYQHAKHSFTLELKTNKNWNYVDGKYVHRTNHQLSSLEGECGLKTDDDIDGSLYSSKPERLFEKLLAEEKEQKEVLLAEALEKTKAEISENTQKIQCELEKVNKSESAKENDKLLKGQDAMKLKLKEINERHLASLKSKDEKIQDMEASIRDLKAHIKAQRDLAKSSDAEEFKEGFLEAPNQSNPESNNSRKRGGGNTSRKRGGQRRR
ncbi:hypothetical protein OROMI_028317 [Orobanche minor]